MLYEETKQKRGNASDWMSEEEASSGAKLIYSVIMIALTILHGYTLSVIWAWFVVPLEIPAISIPHAMGLSLFISLFKSHKPEKYTHEWYIKSISYTLSACFVVLGMGWVFAQLM